MKHDLETSVAELSKRMSASKLDAVEEHRLRKENKALRKELDRALSRKLLDQRVEDFLESALRRTHGIPDWSSPKRSSKRHEVIPMLEDSDSHFDEEVRAVEVDGRNQYNRAIAERRIQSIPETVTKISHNYVKGFTYPGIVVTMLGDNFSGNIHDELLRNNLDTVFGGILYWIPRKAAMLRQLADAFGKVWVISVAGNHGRTTRKPVAKLRARDNFDWLFSHLVARELSGDKRFTFCIPESQKQQFRIYSTRFIASHGDEARGGSGIAGMLSPQLIAMARMRKLYEFDYWLLGHWHYRASYRGIKVNGSIKGYDEYAVVSNFDFQEPCQDLSFVSPTRGIISEWPVFLEDPKRKVIPENAVRFSNP